MALSTTTRKELRYPNLAEAADLAHLIQILAEDVDVYTVGWYVPSVIGSRPAAGKIGAMHLATDTGAVSLDDGTTWHDLGVKDGSVTSSKYGPVTITPETADYTLTLADSFTIVEMNKATAVALNIPTNASVAFPVGTVITVTQVGAGQVTITPAGGVTLRANPGAKIISQYGVAQIYKRATNEWVAMGNLTA